MQEVSLGQAPVGKSSPRSLLGPLCTLATGSLETRTGLGRASLGWAMAARNGLVEGGLTTVPRKQTLPPFPETEASPLAFCFEDGSHKGTRLCTQTLETRFQQGTSTPASVIQKNLILPISVQRLYAS